jgi:phosphoglucomutase
VQRPLKSVRFTYASRSERPYVNDLRNVIDMDAIRSAGLKLAVDPLERAEPKALID